MKQVIYSTVDASKYGKPRTRNSFTVTIDDVSEFNTIDDLKTAIKHACEPHAVSGGVYFQDMYLSCAESILQEGVSKWGDEFLGLLKTFKNASNFDEFIQNNVVRFNKVSNGYTNQKFYDLAYQVQDYINDLQLHGLRIDVRRSYLFLTYNLDESRYALLSTERVNNWNKVIAYLRSMNAVDEVDDVFRYEGESVWADIYLKNIEGDRVTHGTIPRFEDVPYINSSQTAYEVTLIEAPDYSRDQRSKFHRTDDNKMYVVHTYKFKCDDDSVDSFIDEMYSSTFSNSHNFNNWNQYLDWLAHVPFESRGFTMKEAIVKIFQVKQGKGRTIFSRERP